MSPSAGTNFVVKGLVAQASLLTEIGNSAPALNFGKKPFDWMSDSQWQMLLVGVIHFFSFERRAYT